MRLPNLKAALRFVRGQTYKWGVLASIPARVRRQVGNGGDSSVVMAPLQWIMRSFPEAPLTVDRRDKTSSVNRWIEEDDHDMVALLECPNPYYSGELLWRATLSELILEGDSYWIKLRSPDDYSMMELWWVPTCLMEPKWPEDGSKFISHYEYNPGGSPVKYSPDDIVHFRYGIDPNNTRRGLSPLASVLREVFADDEASRFSSALLANMGVPGLIVSPDTDQAVPDDDLEATKLSIMEKTTGAKRGEPMVFGSATKVQQFGFSPQQMDMRTLRKVPEERVSAVTGVAAIVCGLGAGLDRSTFANFKEAREASYEGAIIPLQRLITAVLKHQLLNEFETDVQSVRARFDLSEVRSLQEDQNAIVERKLQELRAGAIMLDEYRRETGREAKDDQNVYLRNFNIVEVREEDLGKPPPPPPQSPGSDPLASLPKPGQGQDANHPLHLPPAVDPTTGQKVGWVKAGHNGSTTWTWGVLPVELVNAGEEA